MCLLLPIFIVERKNSVAYRVVDGLDRFSDFRPELGVRRMDICHQCLAHFLRIKPTPFGWEILRFLTFVAGGGGGGVWSPGCC